MVDIQSPTAEIRRRKKDRKNKRQDENIMFASAIQSGHKKKLKSGLVASYNIRPINGLHKSVTYLLTHPLTYSPGTHTGHTIVRVHAVHLMNAEDSALDSCQPTDQINLDCKFISRLLPSTSTITIYYYSARKLILILPPHGG